MPPPALPPFFMDPSYIMYTAMQWMIYPYYYAMMFEMYRIALEAWKKSFETMSKALEPGTLSGRGEANV